MTSSLSGDLRGQVIGAIEDGISTWEAARRFRIGISTAGPGIPSGWRKRSSTGRGS